MKESDPTGRSDLDTIRRVIRRRGGTILLCAVVACAAALGFSLISTKQYTATAALLFRPFQPSQTTLNTNGAPAPVSISDRDAATNQKLADLYAISQATAAALPAPYNHMTPGTVRGDVAVSSEAVSNVVDVQATSPKPLLSAALANTYAAQFIAARVQADRAAYTQAQQVVKAQLAHPALLSPFERQTLQTQAQQLRLLSVMQTGNAELAQRAEPPTEPSSPKVVRNAAIGFVLGLVLGMALALLLERLDRRIKDVEDLEAASALPVLGIVPESRALDELSPMGPPALEAESFHMLRARLRYFNVDRNIRSLLVVSAAPDDGKSTIAYHLARTAARTRGARVIVVEADLRKPRLASKCGLKLVPGLAELLTQNIALEDVVQQMPTDVESMPDDGRTLDVIVAGARPPNPSELLESHKMSELLERLHAEYDLVVVDTPPTAVVADAIPLMGQVDGVVLVARLNRSTRTGVSRLCEQLNRLGAPTLGVVANRVPMNRESDAYGYGYYSTDERSKPGAPAPSANGSVNGTPEQSSSDGSQADRPSVTRS